MTEVQKPLGPYWNITGKKSGGAISCREAAADRDAFAGEVSQ